ncbi:ATP-dependent DNA helicase 2 subunit 1-like isoform X2 [Ornithodoros turicata]|uniref:ATP-dependent DNA helicase 2 subunit 1-like isoform X2 n=1 Tax=Ornithodoros turicata TaxID=34597 RepID=UPI0031394A48
MDPEWRNAEGDESDNDEYTSVRDYKAGVDGVIFLIDASETMFVDMDDGVLFFHCVKAARCTMMNKIISSPRDRVGIVFFGTKKSENAGSFQHITVFQDMECPGADAINKVENLIKEGKAKFKSEYGHDSFSLSDALWACSMLFRKHKFSDQRVLLFTNTDDPHGGSSHLDQQAKTKAQDMAEAGIRIDLIHVKPPGGTFQVDKLYKDIVSLEDDEMYGDNLPDAASKLDELLTRTQMKDHKKRRVAALEFHLGGDMKFGISLYNLVGLTYRPPSVPLAKATNEELKKKRFTYAMDNGEIVMPSNISKYQEIAGKKIYFNPPELKEMKVLAPQGMHLMGFKPLHCFKPYQHVARGNFIYPDEHAYRGSTRIFAALLDACTRHNVAPVCYFVPRRDQSPKLVYLLAQKEELDDAGAQVAPPGFHVVYLPFYDDKRRLEKLDHKADPGIELVNKAKDITQKLKFTYHPDNFENPDLQRFWSCIEALALEKDDVAPTKDYTKPNYEKIKERAGSELEEFREMANLELSAAAPKKRPPATAGGPSKRAKNDNNADKSLDVRKEAEQGRLKSLTVNVLKEFCKQEGIKCPQKKADLIEAIEKHLGI